jgi:hypothetical protein
MRTRVVRVKTEEQLLSTGWKKSIYSLNKKPSYKYSNRDPIFVNDMFKYLGKVISITVYEEAGRCYLNDFIFTDEMIQEELNPEDYPEFMI